LSTPTNTRSAAERESAAEPGARLERRLPAFYAAFFYAFPAAVAWVWLEASKPGRSLALWLTADWALDLACGAAFAVVVIFLTWVCTKRFAWARALEAEFGWILGAQRSWEIVWIALLSGAAEEYLFRGALQERFGLWVATAVFAVIHWPVNRNFLAWPFLAALVGLGLGLLKEGTDSLLAPALAHALINLVNLRRIVSRFRGWDEDAVNRYMETGRS
jgi:membrane protease YdiL (CAAX protease family)